MGRLVGAVQGGQDLTAPLTFVGTVFVLLQVLTPIHQALSANLGDRTAAWLFDRLTEACVRPLGWATSKIPSSGDLTVAREFDNAILARHYRCRSTSCVRPGRVVGGLASAVVLAAYSWCRHPYCSAARGCPPTGCCAKLRLAGSQYDEVRAAQRDSEYAYRLAVDPPASKELRLSAWSADHRPLCHHRTRLHELQYAVPAAREIGGVERVARRRRERGVFWSLATAAAEAGSTWARLVIFAPERVWHIDDRVWGTQTGRSTVPRHR